MFFAGSLFVGLYTPSSNAGLIPFWLLSGIKFEFLAKLNNIFWIAYSLKVAKSQKNFVLVPSLKKVSNNKCFISKSCVCEVIQVTFLQMEQSYNISEMESK